jgi:hypothetical protein
MTPFDHKPRAVRVAMAGFALTLALALCLGLASAQTPSAPNQPGDSPHSTGRTVLPPETQGVVQPQGPTGPLETGTGGAPASSPQGQSPPGMQAAPEGADKTIVDPTNK